MKGTGEFAGLLEIRVRGSAVDLGYALSRRWWRQGFMSEASQSVLQWALAQPEIFRVWATWSSTASWRVQWMKPSAA